MHPEDAEASIKVIYQFHGEILGVHLFQKQLAVLRLSYVDLYLIHCPCAMQFAGGVVRYS